MSWLPPNPLAVGCDEQQNAWVLHREIGESLEMVLSCFDPGTQRLIATHAVDYQLPSHETLVLPVPMAVRSNHVYLGMGAALLTMSYGRQWATTEMGRPITHMVCSHPLTRTRVAVGMDVGGTIFTDDLDNSSVAEGLDLPLFGFSRSGLLLVAAKSEARVFRMSGKRPEYRGSFSNFDIDAATPGAAILPTNIMDEIAIVLPDASVQILDVGSAAS